MWMFGSRTTVKKVRNSLTWFSQSFGSNPLKADVGDNVLILIFVHSHLVLDNVLTAAPPVSCAATKLPLHATLKPKCKCNKLALAGSKRNGCG